jgi:ubiquitin C-terminal hydrolase
MLVIQLKIQTHKSIMHINDQLTQLDRRYQLKAIVMHEGANVRTGHYWTACEKGGDWWKYCDHAARRRSLDPCINQFQGI